MSTLALAKKDFQDAIQSWTLLGVSAVFVVFAAGAAWFYRAIRSMTVVAAGPDSSIALVTFLSDLCGFFIPLIGLLVGYKSIVGERERGTLDLLLSFPYTRREIVLGKLIGRTAVVSVAALVGFLIAVGVVIALSGSLSFGHYVVFVVLSIVLAFVFVALGVSLSAATRSSTLALVGAVILFVLFLRTIWTLIPTLIRFALNEYTPLTLDLGTRPEWVQFYVQLNPTVAYSNALQTLIPELSRGVADTPFYLDDPFGFVVLAFWIVVPLLLGYHRFNTTDL